MTKHEKDKILIHTTANRARKSLGKKAPLRRRENREDEDDVEHEGGVGMSIEAML